MKLKIGVMGSASGKLSKAHKKIAYELGCAIAEKNCITVTGACPGFPLEAAKGASRNGGLVVGISPALSEREHIEKYHSPVAYHDVLIFTGSSFATLWILCLFTKKDKINKTFCDRGQAWPRSFGN